MTTTTAVMSDTVSNNCCLHCKRGKRSLWEFAHNHLQVVDVCLADEACMICLENFDSIDSESGLRDVPVRIKGVEGCSHVYGLACLQRMWAFSAIKGGVAKSAKNVCMLDKTKWFSSVSVVMPQYPEAVKRGLAKMLARGYRTHVDTARYFLFREDEFKAEAQIESLSAILRQSEMEQCIKWAVEMSEPAQQVVKLARVQQVMATSNAERNQSSTQKVRRHFGFKSNHWEVRWCGLMDPFAWTDFTTIHTCHYVRLAVAAYQTEKGKKLYTYARQAVKRHWSSLQDTRSVVRCALSIAELFQKPSPSELGRAVDFVAVVLLAAELQRNRGVELAILPGMAGTAWQYMSWVESFTLTQRLQYLDLDTLERSGRGYFGD